MKTNFTQRKFYIIYLLLVAAIFMSRKSFGQVANITKLQPDFSISPSLDSGTLKQIGAKYRFANVLTGIDAVVTIVSSTGGASVSIFDDNATTKPEAFSPAITIPANTTGLVEFKVQFVTTNTNNPVLVSNIDVTAIDIDGSGGLREMDVLDLNGGTLSKASVGAEINVVSSGTQFIATNVAGIEYAGIDTSAKQVMFTVSNQNISSFIYKAGGVNNAGSSTTRQKSIYFKSFSYKLPASLPVVMSYFNAIIEDNSKVKLNWVTEMELNNDYYSVERSLDGRNFTTIAMVLGSLNSSIRKTYEYKDNLKGVDASQTVCYRIKQSDVDGKTTYSPVRSVKLSQKQNMVQVNPNPFVDNLTVKYISDVNGTMSIRLINTNGQVILNKTSSISKGFNSQGVYNLGFLPKGMYIAEVIINGELSEKTKLVKN